jgi:hypothetical protein
VTGPGHTLRRLVGVYDADHTVRGELSYWIGARFGRAHCALCDITHGLVRERADWRACRATFPVPFDTFHRDDQPDAVRRVVGTVLPSVVAETDDGVVILLDPAALDACNGSVDRLAEAIDAALTRLGLIAS